MEIHLTVYELWFWRVGIMVVLFLSIQGHFRILKQLDLIVETNNQIGQIAEYQSKQDTINMNTVLIEKKIFDKLDLLTQSTN